MSSRSGVQQAEVSSGERVAWMVTNLHDGYRFFAWPDDPTWGDEWDGDDEMFSRQAVFLHPEPSREREALEALRRAAQRFVMKVDQGRVASGRSYREFKAALEKLEKGERRGGSD